MYKLYLRIVLMLSLAIGSFKTGFCVDIAQHTTNASTYNQENKLSTEDKRQALERRSEMETSTYTDRDNIYEVRLKKAGVDLPKFTDYQAVHPEYVLPAAPLDLTSHTLATKYKDEILNAMKSRGCCKGGVEFAGNYSIVKILEKSGKQMNIIVDFSTGKVVDYVYSDFGISHRIDSDMIITNRVTDYNVEYIAASSKSKPIYTHYYILRDDKLKKIKSIPVYKYSKELLQAR